MHAHATTPPVTVDAHQWADLPAADRALLQPTVLERWTRGLAAEEVDLAEVARLERQRQNTLRTLREGAELTDREWQLVRYLSKHQGQVRTYLQIARHLWQTPSRPITPRSLVSLDAGRRYSGSLIVTIQVLIHQIRKKLEIDPLRPQHFATVRGVGYVFYSAPPSLDDGIDYARRATQYGQLREQIRTDWGLEEGEYIMVTDRDGQTFESRVALGPEHPDRRALDAGH